jgi:hypothetical protein
LQPPKFSPIFIGVILLYILNTAVPILLLLLLGSFVHVLAHEMGHAAPILIGTQAAVTVHIGSFGDARHSFGWVIGRLTLRIKYNPLLWFRGMCQPFGDFSLNQQLLYIATGPLSSLLLGIISCLLLLSGQIPGFLRLWLGFIVLFSLLGLLGSTVPVGRQRLTAAGRPVQPDLIAFLRLWRSKRLA